MFFVENSIPLLGKVVSDNLYKDYMRSQSEIL